MKLPREHRYRYEIHERWGGWLHVWLIITRHGAIHFHVTEPEEGRDYGPSAGLEIHYRTPPEHMAEQAPTHDECPVIHQPCWHDGTSLYAEDVLLPRWRVILKPQEMFPYLLGEISRFEEPGTMCAALDKVRKGS